MPFVTKYDWLFECLSRRNSVGFFITYTNNCVPTIYLYISKLNRKSLCVTLIHLIRFRSKRLVPTCIIMKPVLNLTKCPFPFIDPKSLTCKCWVYIGFIVTISPTSTFQSSQCWSNSWLIDWIELYNNEMSTMATWFVHEVHIVDTMVQHWITMLSHHLIYIYIVQNKNVNTINNIIHLACLSRPIDE